MTRRPPSKMSIAQLRVALTEAKQDTKNTGEYWSRIAKRKDGKIERVTNQRQEAIQLSHKYRNEANSLKTKLTASDQQCQEYKSMAEHCGADEIKELKCTVKTQSFAIRRRNDEIHELKVKIKCLVDELAKLNSDLKAVQTISDSVKMDCNLWPIDTGGEQVDQYTHAPTDAHAEIKAVQSVLDSANAQIDALETQIKNQSDTILRMAGQMHNGQNNDSDKIGNGSTHRLGNEIVDLGRQAERRKNRHKRTTDRLEIRISVLNELIADQALSIKELREN